MDRRSKELPSAPAGEPVNIEFEGRPLQAKVGESVQVALLAHGIDIASRSVKYHRPRGPFCLSGTCGQCWMRIDDIPNRPACVTPVHEGLEVQRQNAYPDADNDVLRAADFVFPRGLDHHSLGTTPVSAMNSLIGSTARQLAGLGVLSEKVAAAAPSVGRRETDVLIVGAGPAGLEAAMALRSSGSRWLLVDAQPQIGGHLASGMFEDEASLMELLVTARGSLSPENVWLGSIAAGVYKDHDQMEVLVVRDRGKSSEHLAVVRARALVLATGGYEVTPMFANDDLPGHFGARALTKLLVRHGVLPGTRVAVLDPGVGRRAGAWLHRKLRSLGIASTRLTEAEVAAEAGVLSQRRVVEAHGQDRIKAVSHVGLDGKSKRLNVDLVASAYPVSPAYELAQQAGCEVVFRKELGGFVVVTATSSQRSSVRNVFAAGDLAGALTPEVSREQGAVAGRAAAEVVK